MSDKNQKNISKFVTTYAAWEWSEREQTYILVERDGYWYEGPWALAHNVAPTWLAEDFRFRNDDGSISAATWIAAQNTAVVKGDGIAPGDNVRLRLNFGEEAGAAGTGEHTGGWTLQFNINGGTFATVTGATAVKTFDSSNLTNGTTLAFANYNLAYSGGAVQRDWGDENEDGVTPTGNTWSKDFCEAEFSIQFDSSGTSEDDVIRFRVLAPDGSTAVAFTNVPTITMAAAGANPIAGSADVAFAVSSANLDGTGELLSSADSTTIIFTTSADPSATGKAFGSTDIAFAVSSANLDATGKAFGSADVAFSESASLQSPTRIWANVPDVLPWILPGTYGSFVKADGASTVFATASTDIAFAVSSANLLGTGKLESPQPTVIAFDTSATAFGRGALPASADIAFAVSSANLDGTGAAVSSATVIFTVSSANLDATGQLIASSDVAFVASAQHNRMFAATNIDWSTSVDLNGTGAIAGSADVAFAVVSADLTGTGSVAGSADIAFSVSATTQSRTRNWAGTSLFPDILPGPLYGSFAKAPSGSVAGAVSIDWTTSADPSATGALLAAPSIDWSTSADPSADGDLAVATSIDWSTSADLVGDIQAIASATVAFDTSATLAADDAIVGSEAIAFDTSATALATGKAFASAEFAFEAAVALTSNKIVGSTSIAFSESVDLGQPTGPALRAIEAALLMNKDVNGNVRITPDIFTKDDFRR